MVSVAPIRVHPPPSIPIASLDAEGLFSTGKLQDPNPSGNSIFIALFLYMIIETPMHSTYCTFT